MCTGSDEIQLFVSGSVNQQPVWLDMALSARTPVSGKVVVTIFGREMMLCLFQSDFPCRQGRFLKTVSTFLQRVLDGNW